MPRKSRKRVAHRHIFPTEALFDHFPPDTPNSIIAERIGAEPNTVVQWRSQPRLLSTYQADRYAIHMGEHPSMIWKDWFDLTEYVPEQRQRILESA